MPILPPQAHLSFPLSSLVLTRFIRLNSALQGNGTTYDLQKLLSEIKYSPLLDAADNLISYCSSGNYLFPLPSTTSSTRRSRIATDPKGTKLLENHASIFLETFIKLHPKINITVVDFHQRFLSSIKVLSSYWLSSDDPKEHLLIAHLSWLLFRDFIKHIPISQLQEINHLVIKQHSNNRLSLTPFKEITSNGANVLLSIDTQLQTINLDRHQFSEIWFSNQESRRFLKTHDYDCISWFNQEAFIDLLDLSAGALFVINCIGSDHFADSLSKFNSRSIALKKIMLKSLNKSDFNETQFRSDI